LAASGAEAALLAATVATPLSASAAAHLLDGAECALDPDQAFSLAVLYTKVILLRY
jgi:hypothetical protein